MFKNLCDACPCTCKPVYGQHRLECARWFYMGTTKSRCFAHDDVLFPPAQTYRTKRPKSAAAAPQTDYWNTYYAQRPLRQEWK